MYYIYQRISTEKQSLIRQEGAISEYCKANSIEVPEENIFSDVITGKTIKRENYQKMKSKLQKEDVLIMLDLDRLGRNWDLIKKEWKELTDKGVYIIIVNCPLINVMPDSNGTVSIDKRLIQSIMLELLCYLSQKEVEKISTRTKEGLKARREAGVRLGAPPKLTVLQRAEILAAKKVHTCREIAEMYGVDASTISRIK
jgi:DNA invertase Pin-like site-specific DNA recombinase